MKLILFVVSLMLVSCQLHDEFPMETITETDAQGNYIGNVDPEDWIVHDFQSSDVLKFSSLTANFGECTNSFLEQMEFKETISKPIVRVFPNPVQTGHPVMLQISHTKRMKSIIYQRVHQNFFTCAGGGMIIDSTGGIYTTQTIYVPFPGDFDTEIILAFIASDSSTFVTKGDIKIIND